MSSLIITILAPNMNSARDLAISVSYSLGPRNIKLPTGRLGSFMPLRGLIARATAWISLVLTYQPLLYHLPS